MEIFKTVPAYSWLFKFISANTEIYVKNIKPIEKLSRCPVNPLSDQGLMTDEILFI